MAVGDIRPRRAARSHPADRVISHIAATQHGVVARRQLLAQGVSRHEIQSRLRNGRLHGLHFGVYAVGHNRLTQRGGWIAAVLACGEQATLSHRSAAALWGMADVPDARIEVVVPHDRASRHRADRASIATHGTRGLPDDQRTVRHTIPVTTVSRTLLDLAGSVSPRSPAWCVPRGRSARTARPAQARGALQVGTWPCGGGPAPSADSRTPGAPRNPLRARAAVPATL